MSSESSDTPDLQTQIELLDSECNELKGELNSAADALAFAASSIDGWDYDGGDALAYNIDAMAGVLIDAIKKRDARVQSLQLKLGQAAEKL